jgi:hypothetical protein
MTRRSAPFKKTVSTLLETLAGMFKPSPKELMVQSNQIAPTRPDLYLPQWHDTRKDASVRFLPITSLMRLLLLVYRNS